jgi:cytochrome c peroxidase
MFLALLCGCVKDVSINPKGGETLATPPGFPVMENPDDNPFSQEKWELGKQLFYSNLLSIDSTVSCASCHKPEFAFSDNRATSPGVENRPGVRNSPSLTNIGYHPYFTREGGVPSLEMQVLVPVQEHNEFDFNMIALERRLQQNAEFNTLAEAAYGTAITYKIVMEALATFERSLVSGNSRYDQYVNQGKLYTMTTTELAGMELFFSERTNCFKCHGGFNFTNYGFENNGLYVNYSDPGRNRLTGKESDVALFKVPSLRNIEFTAPYMHDGSVKTLADVIEHYNGGGKNHVHQSPLIQPLNLSQKEKRQLEAFLKSLTDHEFMNNLKFRN